MSRNSVLTPPKAEEKPSAAPEKRPAPPKLPDLKLPAQPRVYVPLSEALLENSPTRHHRSVWDYVVSVAIHGLFLGVLILLPLYFTEAIDLNRFSQTILVAPPPPPPPPPPAAPQIVQRVSATRRVFQQAGRLVAPTVIPKQVAMLEEKPEDLAPDVGGIGVAGGVPGGVPGGQIGGVIGGIISGTPRSVPPPPPPTTHRAPVRVGGRVLPPRVISAPNPVYPPLAKQARLEGDVQIDAVIDAHGNVVQMQVLSGHPLLINSALDALSRWKYQPTILNDEPVSVQLVVTVRFRLSGNQ